MFRLFTNGMVCFILLFAATAVAQERSPSDLPPKKKQVEPPTTCRRAVRHRAGRRFRRRRHMENPRQAAEKTDPPQVNSNWGHLRGRFVFSGQLPQPKNLALPPTARIAGPIPDERLIVNQQNRGIANILVYLYRSRRDEPPTVHPAYEEMAGTRVKLEIARYQFDPHIVLLRTNQMLAIYNLGVEAYGVKIDTFYNPTVNYIIPVAERVEHRFSLPERRPSSLSCTIHSWMSGYLLVSDHPYMAVTDENGRFEIKNLPVGEWTFQTWQERAGYLTDVSVGSKPTTWKQGRFTIKVEPGVNDLGNIKIDRGEFQ